MATFWKDIDNEFKRKNNGDILDMNDHNAINNSLTNIFSTIQGSRRMLPEFALSIYHYLFEPVDEITASSLAELIWDAVERWETRIVVDGLEVIADNDNNYYEINLNYFVGNVGNIDNIQNFTDIIRAR